MNLLFLTLLLYLIIDPMGNVSNYLKLMNQIPEERRKRVALREMFIALGVMILFNELGEVIFNVMGFSETALRLASGLILFLVAIKILFPIPDQPRIQILPGEPVVFPIAIPMIAGPALIATVMLYAHLEKSQPFMLLAILLAWAGASLTLFFSSFIKRTLGNNGIAAIERLMGMILVLLAIQRITAGIKLFMTGSCCD